MAWAESAKKTTARITAGEVQYEEYTTTVLYVQRVFPTDITHFTITNDTAGQDVQFSFDGATLDGEIKSNETITINTVAKTSVYIKSDSGGAVTRYWAY